MAPVAGQARAGPAVPGGREPHLPARRDLLAGRRALAGVAVLRLDRLRARERILAGDARAVRRTSARIQAMLQATRARPRPAALLPDARPVAGGPPGHGGKRLLHFTAHDVGRWLHQHPTGLGRVAGDLLARGVMFDFVSDRLLARVARARHGHPGPRRAADAAGDLGAPAPAGRGGRHRGVRWAACPTTCPAWARWTSAGGQLRAALAALGPGERLGADGAALAARARALPAGARRSARRWRPAGVRARADGRPGPVGAAPAGRRGAGRRSSLLPGQPGRPSVRGLGAAGHARRPRRW